MSSPIQLPIGRVREFWDRRPCNIRHPLKPIGTREYFDEVEARKYFVEPHIRGFADFERWRNKWVLEIRCGIGTDTINFARHGAWVTAVDLSGKSLEIAGPRAAVFRVEDRIRFHKGDAEELSEFIPVEAYDSQEATRNEVDLLSGRCVACSGRLRKGERDRCVRRT